MGGIAIGAENITHRYDHITALADATLMIRHGEIHGLIGENGAGKSTIVRILAGIETPDSGTVSGDPSAVAIVPQTPRLAPSLPVWQNLLVGCEPHRGPFLNKREAIAAVEAVASRFAIDINLRLPAARLNQTEQRLAALLSALVRDPNVLLLDEPAVGLAPLDRDRIHRAVCALRENGRAVLYISHDIQEITALADRITVLCDGRTRVMRTAPFDSEQLAQDLFANASASVAPDTSATPSVRATQGDWGDVIASLEEMVVRDPRGGRKLGPLSVTLPAGKIFAITGVRESGLDLLESFFAGELEIAAGAMRLGGKRLPALLDPAELRARHVAFIPSDRMARAAALDGTVTENAIVAERTDVHRRGIRLRGEERLLTERHLGRFGINKGAHLPLGTLSGGTIQKLILARELGTNPRLCIVAEPSAGLDLRSIARLYEDLRNLAAGGAAVLLLSSHVDSVLPVADGVAVLFNGAIRGEFLPTQKPAITRTIAGLERETLP